MNSPESPRDYFFHFLLVALPIVAGTLVAFINLNTPGGEIDLTPPIAHAQTAVVPTLPQVYLDTTYNPPTGTIISVAAGGDFQAAINSAQPGQIIELQAGATYTGNFTLPNKSGTAWIYIRSSAYNQLPSPGNRVSPSQASLMPKIVSPNSEPALATADGAHHYRFVGIEFTVALGVNTIYSIVELGSNQPSIAQLPHDIIVDRSYIHGQPTGNLFRCIVLNGSSIAVIDSYVSEAHVVGFDSQAILGYNGPGLFKIVNNYLEGSGENVMFGGADPSIANLVPSDIEIRGNYFFKPLSWRVGDPSYAGTPWSVKNLFELKNARRVLIEGNIFENSWAHSQVGYAVLFTVRNQDGTAPWSDVSDITFRKNIIRHAGGGFTIHATDSKASQVTKRLLIENNVLEDISRAAWGGTGWIFIMGNSCSVPSGPQTCTLGSGIGIVDLTLNHNTGFSSNAHGFSGDFNNALHQGFVDTNNIFAQGVYGFLGSGTGDGDNTLAYYFSSPTFRANAIIGGFAGSWASAPGNFFPPNTEAVGFTNYAGGDYHLLASSPYKNAGTDGKDIGADIDAVNAATACAINGQCGSAPPPPPSDTTAPSIPTGVLASAISQTQINLSWTASTDNVGVTGYKIYRSGTQIATVTSGTSYQNTGLSPATTYSYTVSAYDAVGNTSSQSSSASATTQTPPPTTLTCAPLTQTLQTNLPAAFSAAGGTGSYSWVASGGSPSSGSGASFSTTYGTSGTRAVTTTSGTQTATCSVTVTLPPPSSDTQAPTIPQALIGTAISSSQISLSWNQSTDNVGVTGYKIYRSDSAIATTPSLSYTDSNLSPQTSYSYTVSAYDVVGNTSGQSASVSLLTQAQAPSPSPTDPPATSVPITMLFGANPPTIASGGSTNLIWTSYGGATSCTASGAWSGTKSPAGGETIGPIFSNTIYTLACTGPGGTALQSVTVSITNSLTQSTPTPPPFFVSTPSSEPVSPNQTSTQVFEGPTLWIGSRDPQVKTLQDFLISQGILAPGNNTGYFGPLTQYAVIRFQQRYSIPGTGVVGPLTYAKINELRGTNTSLSTQTNPNTTYPLSFTRSLYIGLRGSDVTRLQVFLITKGFLGVGNNTGYFGPLTEDAVRVFQCEQNIVCSGTRASTGWGVVGPKTRAVLNILLQK